MKHIMEPTDRQMRSKPVRPLLVPCKVDKYDTQAMFDTGAALTLVRRDLLAKCN